MPEYLFSTRGRRLLLAAIPISALLTVAACGDDTNPTGSGGTTTTTATATTTGSGGTGAAGGGSGATGGGGSGGGAFATYANPLAINIPGGGLLERCPDPAVIRGQTQGDDAFYVYCTSGPLNSADKDPMGGYNTHFLPILKSTDLITW